MTQNTHLHDSQERGIEVISCKRVKPKHSLRLVDPDKTETDREVDMMWHIRSPGFIPTSDKPYRAVLLIKPEQFPSHSDKGNVKYHIQSGGENQSKSSIEETEWLRWYMWSSRSIYGSVFSVRENTCIYINYVRPGCSHRPWRWPWNITPDQ